MTRPKSGAASDRPPTMKAVAEAAGVGLGTVSRALAGDGQDVSVETRARVLKAAEELRYRPSALGRGLKRQQTDTLGLLVADISNPFYGEFTQAVLEAAEALQRHVIVGSSQEDAEKEQAYVDVLLEQRVDGIIAFPTGANTRTWTEALALGVRVIFADRTVPGVEVPCIVVANRDGMRELAGHVLGQGHRAIGYLGGPIEVSSGALRELGFIDALADVGLGGGDARLVRTDFTRDGALAAARSLLDDPDLTAVLAANNLLGEALLTAAEERGRRVPEDLSMAMFDDVPWASIGRPHITVQAQPTAELGRAAVRMLMADGDAGGDLVLPTRLVARTSVQPVPPIAAPGAGEGR